MLKNVRVIIICVGIMTAIVCQAYSQVITDACEIPASTWMRLGESGRMLFVTGYIAGLEQSAKFMGGKIMATKTIQYKEMSQIVYRHLLAHPELREGPIGEIILDALRGKLIFTDKFGNPYKSKDK
jgi:hypothetical protein